MRIESDEPESQMIEIEGLSKYYGSIKALEGLSFSVGKGEVVGFLGPNGAGKSTTMNILTGFLSLTEGNVRINGYDIFEHAREARASVGYLPEQPPLYLELSVTEYLHHVCGLKKLPRRTWSQELQRVLAMCALEDVARRKIAYLSKGFRQRVGLAQALLGSPPLLILDEPTVGLDPHQIVEIRNLIGELSKEHTILLSSHILSEVEVICQRVLILHEGRLVADDQAANLNTGFCELRLELLASLDPALIAEGFEDKLANILKEFEVRDFVVEQQQALYRVEFQLPVMTDSAFLEARRDLSEQFTREGFTIVAMVPHQSSLEEIFFTLTQTKLTQTKIEQMDVSK